MLAAPDLSGRAFRLATERKAPPIIAPIDGISFLSHAVRLTSKTPAAMSVPAFIFFASERDVDLEETAGIKAGSPRRRPVVGAF